MSGPVSSARTLSVEMAALFPTRVWQARLDGLKPLFPQWVAAATAWNGAEKTLLDQPVFEPLTSALRAACAHALAQMGQTDPSFAIESWPNILNWGGYNPVHRHEGRLLSGVFYLQVPQGSGPLVFRDPRPGVQGAPFKGPHANGHNDIQLAPSAGLAVLFPNWLDHFVEPHDNDVPRISISFNALVRKHP